MSTLKTNNIQHVDLADPSIIINTDGSVNIAGTMTYEDVTNVDSVGIITARKQLHVGTGVSIAAGGLNVTAGVSTFTAIQVSATAAFSGDVDLGNASSDAITFTGRVDSDLNPSGSTRDLGTSGVEWRAAYLLNGVVASDTIATHAGDTDTKIRFPGTDIVTVELAGTEYLRVDTTALRITDKLAHTGDPDTMIRFPAADTITAETGGSERIRINSNGVVLHGHNSPLVVGSTTFETQIVGDDFDNSSVLFARFANDQNGPSVNFLKSRNATLGSNTLVQSGDELGKLRFGAADGNDFACLGAEMKVQVDAAPGQDDMPSRFVFSTTRDTQASPTRSMTIDQYGRLFVGDFQSTTLSSGGVFSELCIGGATEGAGIHLKDTDSNVHGGMFTSDSTNAMIIRTITNHPMHFRTNNTDRIILKNDGTFLHGAGAIATQKASNGGLDVSCNTHSIVFGADNNSGNLSQARTNDAAKDGRIGAAHYHNAEEPIGVARVYSDGANNYVYYGGGSSLFNAATIIGFYTAANDATTNGTERLQITSAGIVDVKSGQLQVNGNSASVKTIESGGATVKMQSGGSQGYFGTETNHHLSIRTNNTIVSEFTEAGDLHICHPTNNASGQLLGVIQFSSLNSSCFTNQEDMYRINFWENTRNSTQSRTDNSNASIRYNGGTSDGGDGSIRFANENATRLLYMNRLGNGGTSGTWSVGSDARKKENITTVTDALTKVSQLRGVDFNWRAKWGGHADSGVLAQEVENILPNLVITQEGARDTDEDGNSVIMKHVNYNGLWGVMIEAVKVLITKNEALEARIATLEKSI